MEQIRGLSAIGELRPVSRMQLQRCACSLYIRRHLLLLRIVWMQDQDGALLVIRFMRPRHDGLAVRVDGQHAPPQQALACASAPVGNAPLPVSASPDAGTFRVWWKYPELVGGADARLMALEVIHFGDC
ncbi:hypothetical protein WK80_20520 [Burkholderia multivorans]|nr:hypothetical protein WK80_20520 [Burkholderia multivorans]OXH89836.1 hypothetical protein CA830_16945 [Burkholderia multivorans]